MLRGDPQIGNARCDSQGGTNLETVTPGAERNKIVSRSLSCPNRTSGRSMIPTPGKHSAVSSSDVPGGTREDQPRKSRGGTTHASQGRNNTMAHNRPPVLSSSPASSKHPLSTGHAGQRPYLEITECPGRPDAKGRPRHGTATAYKKFGCRCPDARRANWRADLLRQAGLTKPKTVASIGASRRLKALAVAGYGLADLAPILGVCETRVRHIRSHKYPTIFAGQHQRIAQMFDTLHMNPATAPNAARTRRLALAAGWAEAFAWEGEAIDDPDAVPAETIPDRDADLTLEIEDAIASRPIGGTKHHRHRVLTAAIRHLTEVTKLSNSEIAERLNVTRRTVERTQAVARSEHPQLPPQLHNHPTATPEAPGEQAA